MNTGVLNTSDGNAVRTTRMHTDGFNTDPATVGATTAVTGVGFQPTHGVIFTLRDTFVNASWGMTDGTASGDDGWATNYLGVADNYGRFAQSIVQYNTAANYINGTVSSWDTDGFTITWTKNGSPTGLFHLRYMVYR